MTDKLVEDHQLTSVHAPGVPGRLLFFFTAGGAGGGGGGGPVTRWRSPSSLPISGELPRTRGFILWNCCCKNSSSTSLAVLLLAEEKLLPAHSLDMDGKNQQPCMHAHAPKLHTLPRKRMIQKNNLEGQQTPFTSLAGQLARILFLCLLALGESVCVCSSVLTSPRDDRRRGGVGLVWSRIYPAISFPCCFSDLTPHSNLPHDDDVLLLEQRLSFSVCVSVLTLMHMILQINRERGYEMCSIMHSTALLNCTLF